MAIELKEGYNILFLTDNGVDRALVSTPLGSLLGELENVPQDEMSCVNGQAEVFLKEEAAKFGLNVRKVLCGVGGSFILEK